jgi:hypothetical protein
MAECVLGSNIYKEADVPKQQRITRTRRLLVFQSHGEFAGLRNCVTASVEY